MGEAPAASGRLRRLLTHPYVVFLWLGVIGFGIAAGIGVYVQPRWTGICDTVKNIRQCQPIGTGSSIAGTLVVFGLVVMIIGPIVAAFWGLRKGWDFEGTRVEPRRVNLTILAGIVYVIAGFTLRSYVG